MRPLRLHTAAIGLACGMAFAPALGGVGKAHPSPDGQAHPAGRPQSPQELVRKVLSQGALEQGWTDLGWAQHSLSPGRPARVDFSGFAGWILSSAQLKPDFGGLLIRYRAPASFGDFLEVYLDSRTRPAFPRVHPGAEARTVDPDGWTSLWIPMSAVDPLKFPFERLVLRAVRSVGSEPVEIETIAFTGAAPLTEREILRTPPRKARVMLDCGKTQPISPLIDGVSFGDLETAAELGASGRRWGGNPSSRYNWKLGNAWNTGKDWFFRNVVMGKDNPPWDIFLAQDRAQGRTTAFTLPMLGWVAKDTVACGFPAALYADPKRFDPETNRCGDGVAADGALLSGSPSAGSVPAPPSFIADWVSAIRAKDSPPRSARLYSLDNEPTLWHLTHRDVHPERLSAEELVERTISYGTAVRVADPEARIAGLAAWGWTALFYSATDKAEGSSFVPADRLKHGGRPLVPWWLSQLRAHDAKSGLHTVDVVDVHFYPQAAGVGLYEDGRIDPEGSARRIRSVRALWAPTYRDESWIGEPMKLIIARIDPTKGHADTVAAFASVARTIPAARLLVVGDGSIRSQIEAEVAAQGLGEKVLMLGWRKDLNDILGLIDVFIHPSLADSWPMPCCACSPTPRAPGAWAPRAGSGWPPNSARRPRARASRKWSTACGAREQAAEQRAAPATSEVCFPSEVTR